MLRARPVHYTSRMDEYAALLTALGLTLEHDTPTWRVFNSGHGKVGLHYAIPESAEDGTTTLGFELRDPEIFVQRTLADGTLAELCDTEAGPSARVTAQDGFSFLADPVTDMSIPAADTDGTLKVMQLWYTQDPAAAQKVLTNIGAKLSVSSATAGWALFKAKNGGLIGTHLGEQNASELSFEYSGDLAELARALSEKGFVAEVIDERYGRTLHVPDPDHEGATIWVNERQSDFYGYQQH